MTALVSRVLCSETGPGLPTEFRIFKAGENPTTKGVFLFDEAAARSVMAAYTAQGVDCMLDLEHLALGDLSRPDASDARGWFKLALRSGELWAVDIKFTPDGARRLSEKTQRYTSPAFLADEHGRISELINVALVAMPATHSAPALVAAARAAARGCAPPKVKHTVGRTPQRTNTLNRMTPEQVKKIMAALEANDAEALAAICKELLAAAAGGGAEPASDVAASDALSDTAADEPKPVAELAALRKQIEALTAGQTAELVKLRASVAALTADREAEDQAERVKLCGQLVVLGAETPATAWAERAKETDPLVPSKRLQGVAIGDLREHVKALSARGPIVNAEPAKTGPTEIKLSKEEQAYCTKHGLTVEQFQAKKAGAVKKATK